MATRPPPQQPQSQPFKPPPNTYTRRQVPPTSPKPCTICHKPSSTVLITPCTRDFFYICPGHLRDRGFASPAPGEPGSGSDSSVTASSNNNNNNNNNNKKTKKSADQFKRERDDATKASIRRITDEYVVRRARRKAHAKEVAAKAKSTSKSSGAEKDKNGKRVKDDTDPAQDRMEEEEEARRKVEEMGTEEGDEVEKARRVEEVKRKAEAEGDGGEGEAEARRFVLQRDVFAMRVAKMREKEGGGGGAARRGNLGGSAGAKGARGALLLSGLPSVPRTLG